MKFRDIRQLLERNDFELYRRCDGSHTIFKHKNGGTIMVPEHHNKEYSPKLLKSITKTIEKYNKGEQ